MVPEQPASGLTGKLNFERWGSAFAENYELWTAKQRQYVLYAIKIEDEIASIIVTDPVEDWPKKLARYKDPIIIRRAWTAPEHRNKGLMTLLYKTLLKKGFTVISDFELTPTSKRIWQKFIDKNLVSTLDVSDGEYSIRKFNQDDLSTSKKGIHLIMFFSFLNEALRLSTRDNSLLQETTWWSEEELKTFD